MLVALGTPEPLLHVAAKYAMLDTKKEFLVRMGGGFGAPGSAQLSVPKLVLALAKAIFKTDSDEELMLNILWHRLIEGNGAMEIPMSDETKDTLQKAEVEQVEQ
eukprot:2070225-Pyramimonas_sp.AAC.1